MFLSYLALFILIMVIVVVVYVFIWLHDFPYRVAKKRNHPNLHAIHIGCWLSLFTLHALWPFLFIWALVGRPQLEVRIVNPEDRNERPRAESDTSSSSSREAAELRQTVRDLQSRLDALEERQLIGGKHG
jgi:hypothetical protein